MDPLKPVRLTLCRPSSVVGVVGAGVVVGLVGVLVMCGALV